jgi:Replication-relaxation
VTNQAPARYMTAHRVRGLERQLRPADWHVLQMLRLLDYATTRQIERVCFVEGTPLGRARRCRRSLRRLVRLRVLHRLDRPIGGATGGSQQGIYTLDRGGWRLLELADSLEPGTHRSPEERGRAFLDHTLAVSAEYVDLVEHLRTSGGTLETWQPEPDCYRDFRRGARTERLTSDAFVEVVAGGEVISSFLEVDRGTESLPTLIRKCRTYLRYARVHPESPQVVFRLSSLARVDRFQRALPVAARAEGFPEATVSALVHVAGVGTSTQLLAGVGAEEQVLP